MREGGDVGVREGGDVGVREGGDGATARVCPPSSPPLPQPPRPRERASAWRRPGLNAWVGSVTGGDGDPRPAARALRETQDLDGRLWANDGPEGPGDDTLVWSDHQCTSGDPASRSDLTFGPCRHRPRDGHSWTHAPKACMKSLLHSSFHWKIPSPEWGIVAKLLSYQRDVFAVVFGNRPFRPWSLF